MTCVRASELLAAYADGGLEGQERDEVAAHVRGCAQCADDVRVLRDVLSDARRLGASPGRMQKDEAFWTDMARDIRVAVAETRPAARWWRLPAVTAAFAVAAAVVLGLFMNLRMTPTPELRPSPVAPAVAAAPLATKPLPRTYSPEPDLDDFEDLDGDQLAAVSAALSSDDANGPSDDELAFVSPAAAETALENLDDADLARVDTAL